MKESKVLNTWVEVINSKSLKDNIIDENPDLKDFDGLILKRMHKSDLKITYEKIEGGLTGFLQKRLPHCSNMSNFLSIARQRFCYIVALSGLERD